MYVCRSVCCVLSGSVLWRIIDCQSCTRTWPTSTNPTSKEAGELGLTRGNCFVVRRPELAAVAMSLWFWRCVFLVRRDFVLFFVFFPTNAQGLRHLSGSLVSFTSLVNSEARPRGSEATAAVLLPIGQKKSLHSGVHTGFHYAI